MDFVYSERVKQCVHRYTPEGREARGPVDKDRSNMGSLEGTCTLLCKFFIRPAIRLSCGKAVAELKGRARSW